MVNDAHSRRFHIDRSYIAEPLKIGNVFLVQIGRTHCAENYSTGDHIHRNWFEITHVIDGKGEITTNGITVPVSAGDLYLSFPADIHNVRTDNETPLKYQFLSVWTEEKLLLDRFESIMSAYREPTMRIFRNRNVENLIGNILNETMIQEEFSYDITVAAINQILRYVVRDFAGRKTSAIRLGSAQELCYQIMNYINTHIYVMDSLHELSEPFGYSYSYLSDTFSKTTGDTIMRYYTQRRMDAAVMLLKENNLSVGEIAELLRYSSVYTFSRAFSTKFGISPTKYKSTEKQVELYMKDIESF